jgi:hypothetical protein
MPKDARERTLLALLVLLALALRLYGTGYALQLPTARPDEDRWVRIGLGLLEDPNPRWFQWPTLHAYLLAVLYAGWGALRLLRGDFPSWHAFMNEPQDVYLADMVLLGRYFSALLGALAVPLAYALGERVGPRGAGLLSALFLAVAFGPVRDAHWALIEPLLLLGILATLLLTLRALERPTLLRFALAGLVAGLTTSAKYNGATLAAPIAAAVFLARHAEGRPLVPGILDRRGLLAALAMLFGFVLGSPYMLVSTREFLAAMEIREWSYRDASFGTATGFWHHLVFSMRYSHGWPLELLGIAGLLGLGWRTPARIPVTVFALATYVAMGPARIVPMRYASSIAPCIALGAAWLLLAALRRPAVVGAVAVLLSLEPLYRDLLFGRLLTREDTRVAARRFLDLHAQPGARIAAPESKAERWARPVLEDRYQVVAYEDSLARERAVDFVVLPETHTGYAPFRPETHALLKGLGRVAFATDPYAPGAAPLYDPHDAFFVPVAGFEGIAAPGPRITIYELRPRSAP